MKYMLKLNKKKIIVGVVLALVVVFLVPGFFDYLEYRKATVEAQTSGFPWQCGVTMINSVTPSCTYTQSGCTCTFCSSSCNGFDQVIFTGQQVCNGATYACIQNGTQIKGGGTSLMEGVGKQAIFAGTSNMQMAGNVVVAIPGATASAIDNVVNWFDKYIIAGFK
jgi:hypothetical protein